MPPAYIMPDMCRTSSSGLHCRVQSQVDSPELIDPDENSAMNDQDKTKRQLIEELADWRRRFAEQDAQLARSRQELADQRQINNSLPVLVATAGLDGYYKGVNSTFKRVLDWSEQESLSRPFIEFIHPDDRAAALEMFEQLESGEPVKDFVDRNVCKDGSYRWISWVVIPLPDRGIVFGIGQDITERKLADDNRRRVEETLLESERKLSTLMSNLPGMAYRCRNDPKWTMEFVSKGALQLTGYPVSDLIESNTVAFGDLIHADDRDVLWDQVQQAIAERRLFQLEYRIRTSAGEERWVWEQGCGVFAGDGELQFLEGFITDITEQKQAELDLRKAHAQLEQRVAERTAELQESNEELRLFKTFAEASGEGFGMSDMDHRIVYGNAALARLVGASKPEDTYGKHPSVYYSDDYHESLKTEILPVLERSGLWQGELTMVSVTGERIPVLQTSFTLVDQDGEAVRRGVVITDLRIIKKAQEALQKEQDALRRILQAGDRDRELITYEIHDGVAQQLLGALMHFEAVSDLVGGVAKEARAKYDTGLTALREASAEARSLMNRTRTPVLNKFGLKSAIADFIDQFTDRPDAPEITYRCEAQFGRLEPVLENTIFRVAQEAITNACIHSKSEMIRVSLIQQDEDVTVEVQDNGIGFDTANVKEGRFGLDGIRERTRLLGKDLQIESTPGKGTRIRTTFPLIHRDEQAVGG